MNIGIISDAHGNLIGLKECINYLFQQNIKKIFHLGDSVGYFSDGSLVIEYLESINSIMLLGNHEAMMIGKLSYINKKDDVFKLEKNLSKVVRKKISLLKPFCEYKIDNRRILLLHGSPWDPLQGYVYPNEDFFYFKNLNYDAIFMGHTHIPFIRYINKSIIVNVGSCGLPRDKGNLLSLGIYNTTYNKCKIIRIKVDIDNIVTHYPNVHQSVINCLKR